MSHETQSPELSRDVARLMLMMRRLVKEEFAVTIRLAEPGSSTELMTFAGRSRNTLLRQMALELEKCWAAATPEPSAAPLPMTYRGATVSTSPSRPEASGESESRARSHKVIYRGLAVT